MRLPTLALIKDPATQQALRRIEEWMSQIEASSGVDPLGTPQNQKRGRVAPPPPATFEVVGADGVFTITISPPKLDSGEDATHGTLEFEVLSSETVPFQASKTRVLRARGPQTVVTIIEPDVSLYFAVRTRFLDSNFNTLVVSGLVDSGSTP